MRKKPLTKLNTRLWLKLFKNWAYLNKEGTYLNKVKAIYDETIANIILNGEKLKHSPWDQEQDKGVHFHHYYST